MNIALIMSAVKQGAIVANYCEVTKLNKDESGKLTGARVKDALTGEEWDVKAKVCISLSSYSNILKCVPSGCHQRNRPIL